MAWAVVVEGRSDPGRILLIIDDKREAETLAHEIRRKGRRVGIEPYPSPEPPAELPGFPRALEASGR